MAVRIRVSRREFDEIQLEIAVRKLRSAPYHAAKALRAAERVIEAESARIEGVR